VSLPRTISITMQQTPAGHWRAHVTGWGDVGAGRFGSSWERDVYVGGDEFSSAAVLLESLASGLRTALALD